MPLEHHTCNRAIAAVADVEGDDEALEEANAQIGKCGHRAWQIAVDLRAAYELPPMNIKEFSWDFLYELKVQHDKSMKRLALLHQVETAYRAEQAKRSKGE